jgi:hemolysin D
MNINPSQSDRNNNPQQLNNTPVLLPENNQTKPKPVIQNDNFDQLVILQQSPIWSRGIIWGIITITSGLVIWSCFAKIDEAVPAQGQLEPVGTVKEVQAPVGGVVKSVAVKDGNKVKEGDILVNFDPTVPQQQLQSLTNIRTALMQENQFYRAIMSQSLNLKPTEIERLNLKPEILSLTKSRVALIAENQLYRTELNGNRGVNFSPEEKQRLQSSLAELNSRIAAGQLAVGQLEKQMKENRAKREGTERLLIVGKKIIQDIISGAESKVSQLDKQLSQNRVKKVSSEKVLQINQNILNNIEPVAKEGALSEVQLLKQQEQVTTLKSNVDELEQEQLRLQYQKSEIISNAQVELSKQKQEISSRQSEIQQLDEEYARLKLAVGESIEKLKNTAALSQKELLAKIADNDKRIAEIDSQLTKALVENDKKLSEIDSQISQAKQTLQYQDIKSPTNGTVFELKAAPGFVANNANSAQPLLKIVSEDNLIAKVFITNKDIGFVKEKMEVDVRIDSFPFSEFGDIKGKVTWIGSDALPPDQIHQFSRFPAKIELETQFLLSQDKQRKLMLNSGMAISVNIKTRSRTVMSIFTDLFSNNVDKFKAIR